MSLLKNTFFLALCMTITGKISNKTRGMTSGTVTVTKTNYHNFTQQNYQSNVNFADFVIKVINLQTIFLNGLLQLNQ